MAASGICVVHVACLLASRSRPRDVREVGQGDSVLVGIRLELCRNNRGGGFDGVIVELVVGESSIIVVLRAETMPTGEVGYPAACMDASWLVRMSSSSLTVL
jgi:hypothetical protein